MRGSARLSTIGAEKNPNALSFAGDKSSMQEQFAYCCELMTNFLWGAGQMTRGFFIGGLMGALLLVLPAAAAAQDVLADPQGSGVIVSAVRWLEGTLLGTIATVVAVIAVAAVGFMMLTGRINWRYGATVILGCFILFGAASIVAGIQSTASLGN